MTYSNSTDRRHQDNLGPSVRAAIGRKGGKAISRDREHMSKIGKIGGSRSRTKKR